MNTVLLMLPDFSLILLGAGLRRWMRFGDHFWVGAEKLVYFVLFPALLVNALLRTHLDPAAALPLLATSFSVIGAGMLLGSLARLFPGISSMAFASIYQCAFRFNSYIGLAVVGMLFGEPGIAAMGIILGAAVPVVNLVSVWALAKHGSTGLWWEILRNPLIWATSVGFALNIAGFAPPAPLTAFLGRLADASIALGLIAVGAALRLEGTSGVKLAAGWLLVVKLLLLPWVALIVGKWVGLSTLYHQVVVLFAALPTASSAYILAMRMGGDGRSVAWIVSMTTLMSMLTLSAWAAWIV